MGQKNKMNYKKLYISVLILIAGIVGFNVYNKKEISVEDVMYVVFLPLFFVGLNYLVDKFASKITKPSEVNPKDEFLEFIAINLKHKYSFSVEDFRRIRFNNKYQECLDICFNISQVGETDKYNFEKVLHKFSKSKSTLETKAINCLVKSTKEYISKYREGKIVLDGINLTNQYGKGLTINYKSEVVLNDYKKSNNEKDRLNKAIEDANKDLEKLIKSKKYSSYETLKKVLKSHILIQKDNFILDEVYKLLDNGEDALSSYIKARDKAVNEFKNLDNEYIKNRYVDIIDATNMVVCKLINKKYHQEKGLNGKIILSDSIKLSDVIYLFDRNISGIIVENEVENSHVAFVLNELKIPTFITKDINKISNNTLVEIGEKLLLKGE